MSGGYFDYVQYHIQDSIETFEDFLENELGNEYHNYSEETIKEILAGYCHLRFAKIYLQRIDWLLSGDDGEESFLKRLNEDLNGDSSAL